MIYSFLIKSLQFDTHFVHDQFSLTQFRRQIAKDV